jgi:hypothetical protein
VALTTIADLVFAGGVVVAALALAGAVLRRGPTSALVAFGVIEAVAAVGIWVSFALRHERPLAVSAAGLTVCALAAAGALGLRSALRRLEATDLRLAEAQADLLGFVEREKIERAAELELTLARARADSRSLLEEQERRLAEERRAAAEEREHETTAALAQRLVQVQTEVEQRMASWSQDLDRAAQATEGRIAELAQRQQRLLGEAELRLAADAERLAAESDEQRAAVARFRSDLDRALDEAMAVARSELETHSAERRRALHELEERLSRRERELIEQAQREEVEAVQRVRAGFEDVARRQVEQLERAVERAVAPYADEAANRFSALVKTSREDSAKRLARELDRAVSTFAREAEAVLAERLAHVGDAGAQRIERRLAEIAGELERRRDELAGTQEQRLSELESDLRRRIDELHADLEAERGVLEVRLQELLRRLPSPATTREI